MLGLIEGLTVDGYSMNIAILVCLLENPYKSWKKIIKEETLSITWDLSWMFCFDSFFFVMFFLRI